MSCLNNLAREVVEKYNLSHSPEIRFIDLASEVGELGKELLKATNYGKTPSQPNINIASEIGDILFSLTCIANAFDIDIADALLAATNKYHARFAISGTVGSDI